jgi:hypothetical protein
MWIFSYINILYCILYACNVIFGFTRNFLALFLKAYYTIGKWRLSCKTQRYAPGDEDSTRFMKKDLRFSNNSSPIF